MFLERYRTVTCYQGWWVREVVVREAIESREAMNTVAVVSWDSGHRR